MPVVINEFETVIDPPRQRGSGDAQSDPQPGSAPAVEAKDLPPLLRVLQVRTLRAWAH